MKIVLHLILVPFLALFATVPAFAAAPPNVVFIISDDQAWYDHGFIDAARTPELIRTPHLDALAARSLVFERGYVPTALCRPSLATIITGLSPHQHGITGNDVVPAPGNRQRRARLDLPLQQRMRELDTLPRLLQSRGYLSFQTGKWWEGSYENGGFTHGMTHGDPSRGGRHGDAGLAIGREGMEPIDEFVQHAVDERKPFFLWYAPFLPHTPHNPPDELLARYAQAGLPDAQAKYLAMCEWFDQTCGELFDILERHQVSDNTIIAYVCDNGWAANLDDPDSPANWASRPYAPRSKTSPYETGIRTPIMVSWPGEIAPARAQHLASSIDLVPTICALLDLPVPDACEGIDLTDASRMSDRTTLFGESFSITRIVVGDPVSTRQYRWCIDGWWKLIVRDDGETDSYAWTYEWDTAPVHLYNLKVDPYEETDLADTHPEMVARLREKLNEWQPAP